MKKTLHIYDALNIHEIPCIHDLQNIHKKHEAGSIFEVSIWSPPGTLIGLISEFPLPALASLRRSMFHSLLISVACLAHILALISVT